MQISTVRENAHWTRQPPSTSSIAELFRSILRHKLLFAVTAIFVTLVGVALTLSLSPSYTANSTVVFWPETGDPLVSTDPRSVDRLDESMLETMTALLRSRDLVREVVERLSIDDGPAPKERQLCHIFPAIKSIKLLAERCRLLTPAERLNGRIDGFLSRLQVRPLPRSRILSISYIDKDPKLAAESINLLVSIRQEAQLAKQKSDLTRTADWLEARSNDLRDRWLTAERKAGEASAKEDMVMTPNNGIAEPLVSRQIASAATDYSQARTQLAAAEARAAAVASVDSVRDRLAFVRMADEPLLVSAAARLNDLYTRQAQLTQSVGPRHPDVLAVTGQIAEAERTFAAERTRVVNAIKEDVTTKRAQVASLEKNLTQVRTQGTAASTRIVSARALDREAASARTIYETFLERTKQISDRASILQSSLQFVSQAEVPTSPSGPAIYRFLVTTLLVAVAAGAAMALLREYFVTGFLNIERVNEVAGLPILAAIPRIPRWRRLRVSLSNYVLQRPFSIAADSMRTILTHALLARAGTRRGQSLMVTSSTSGEGKSTICHWLSTICANSSYNVLVIDADYRKLSNSRRREQPKGLTDLLMTKALFREVVQQDDLTSVWRIGPGAPLTGPFGKLQFQNLKTLLDTAANHYDLIVIDAPPMLASAETMLYASLVDKVILAYEWRQTSRNMLFSALERLHKANANVLGVVVTGVAMKSFPQYSDERRLNETSLLSTPHATSASAE